MALSAFADKSSPPTPDAVAAVLGPAWEPWQALQDRLQAEVGPLAPIWGFTSKSTGWGLRLRRGERVVLYLTPQAGQFLASLALGDRALAVARGSGLPPQVLAVLDAAPRYAEGTGVRLVIRQAQEIPAVLLLARAKLAT